MAKTNICHNDDCMKKYNGVNKSNLVSYILGFKYCRECRKYFKVDYWKCLCCGSRLRGKPANGVKREELVVASRV